MVIVACGAALMFGQSNGKEATQINFLSNDTLQNGEQVQFELKDAGGKAVSGQTLNITYDNQKYSVVTDNDGKGYLSISGEDAGTYDITVDYAGSDKYDACTAKATITITDDVPDDEVSQTDGDAVATTDQYNSTSDSSDSSDDNGGSDNSSNPYEGDIAPTSFYIPTYGLWVSYDDYSVIASDNGEGEGMNLDDWVAQYGKSYDDPDYH